MLLYVFAFCCQPGEKKKKPQYRYKTVEELKVGPHCLPVLWCSPTEDTPLYRTCLLHLIEQCLVDQMSSIVLWRDMLVPMD